MKMIDFEKAKKYMYEGEPVFMVKLDGSLKELTESISWMTLFFHNIKGGSYAVYRRKSIGEFHKEIHIGKKVFTVDHIKKGGGSEWKLASYRAKQ
jgi:hypothetical protein